MRQHARLVALVPAGLLLCSLVPAGAHAAAGARTAAKVRTVHEVSTATRRWSKAEEVPGSASLNTGGSAQIQSVACRAEGDCSAGGALANQDQSFVVTQKDGRWGKAELVPGTAAVATGGVYVSCASVGNCVAGGQYLNSSGYGQSFIATQRNGRWQTAQNLSGFAALGSGGGSLASVSCGSLGNCVAGGAYLPAPAASYTWLRRALVVSERNGRWQKVREVPGVAAADDGILAATRSVSCAAPDYCAAGGFHEAFSAGEQAFLVTATNGSWGKSEAVPGLAALNTGKVAEVSSISCLSPGRCAAGGTYTDSAGHSQAFVVTEANRRWGKAEEVPGTAALNAGGSAQFTSVSCSAPGDCAAGGTYTDSAGHSQAFVVTDTNSRWGKAEEVPGTAALNAGGSAQLTSVSCAAAGDCAAGGSYTDAAGHSQAFVVTDTNGRWGKAEEVPGTAALNAGGSAQLSSVSCAGAGHCSAGGYYTTAAGDIEAFVVSEG